MAPFFFRSVGRLLFVPPSSSSLPPDNSFRSCQFFSRARPSKGGPCSACCSGSGMPRAHKEQAERNGMGEKGMKAAVEKKIGCKHGLFCLPASTSKQHRAAMANPGTLVRHVCRGGERQRAEKMVHRQESLCGYRMALTTRNIQGSDRASREQRVGKA